MTDFEKADPGFVRKVLELSRFMTCRGYDVPPAFPDTFFRIIPAMDPYGMKLKDFEPVFRTLMAKSPSQSAAFHGDFKDFIDGKPPYTGEELERWKQRKAAEKRIEEELADKRKQYEGYSKSIDQYGKKLKTLKQDRAEFLKTLKFSPTLKNACKKTEGDFGRMLDTLQDKKAASLILSLISGDGDWEQILDSTDRISKAVNDLMEEAVFVPHFRECFGCLKKIDKLVKSAKNKAKENSPESVSRMRSKIEKMKREQERVQEKINLLVSRRLEKESSQTHREEFIGGRNAVQAHAAGIPQESFDKTFSKLSGRERDSIRRYIWQNTRKFRTRLSRNIRTGQRREIDMPETCKKACCTGGIPMKICFKKQVPARAKLIMFLDVSGSCKQASEMMLFFMYCMKEAFPAGCRTYAFVNSLYDISGFFETKDPDKAICDILAEIPRSGQYSNYFVPIRDFCEEHFSDVNRDSIVLFIGDARNNQNDSGVYYFRKIARKCRNAYWFNTEERKRWDTADSVIAKYAPYMKSVSEVLTTNDLLRAMEGIK